jgi:hypothetical protein
MPLLSLLAFCLLAWLSCTAAAGAADSSPPPSPRIWSGVVLATNGAHPGQAPERLRKYAGKLKNIFGYNQYELIGESSARIDDPKERWLVPSKDFSLSVQSHYEAGVRRPPTRITLFQGSHRVAEFEANLTSGRPLFIRGPFYARGQLVIVVHVRDSSEIPFAREGLRPAFIASPNLPPGVVTLPRDKERPNIPPGYPGFPAYPGYPQTVPKEEFRPLPVDHFGPMPGEHHGSLDKMGQPEKGPPF